MTLASRDGFFRFQASLTGSVLSFQGLRDGDGVGLVPGNCIKPKKPTISSRLLLS